ncbi:MAG: pyridoxamine 5'-phosphate oxidase family protein [Actinomycetota bacterium]
MVTWKQFREVQPELAEMGRSMYYQWNIGLAFLGTTRKDGAPRVHPVCPVATDDGMYVFIQPGPKLDDLRRDPRYALHCETYAPPRHDDGFLLSGRVGVITDASVVERTSRQLFAERDTSDPWPGFNENVLVELMVDRALLMLTEPIAPFPKGPTAWRPPSPT